MTLCQIFHNALKYAICRTSRKQPCMQIQKLMKHWDKLWIWNYVNFDGIFLALHDSLLMRHYIITNCIDISFQNLSNICIIFASNEVLDNIGLFRIFQTPIRQFSLVLRTNLISDIKIFRSDWICNFVLSHWRRDCSSGSVIIIKNYNGVMRLKQGVSISQIKNIVQ